MGTVALNKYKLSCEPNYLNLEGCNAIDYAIPHAHYDERPHS